MIMKVWKYINENILKLESLGILQKCLLPLLNVFRMNLLSEFPKLSANGIGLGEVADPEAK